MTILKEVSFNIPFEGRHSGIIESAKLKEDYKTGRKREQLRLVISLDSVDDRLKEYKACKSYWENNPEELTRDLSELLGDQLSAVVDRSGTIVERQLDLLKGKPVQFDVTFYHESSNKKPFCNVGNLKLINGSN